MASLPDGFSGRPFNTPPFLNVWPLHTEDLIIFQNVDFYWASMTYSGEV